MEYNRLYKPKQENVKKLEAFLKKLPSEEKEKIKITKDKQ